MTPLKLASQLHSLPPILHKSIQKSTSSYSKGARGLSVLSRVTGIFTGTTNSLSISLRQRPTRYAIHARRNLPDKVLRYLRTVIVTAAVYRGFDSKLCPYELTSPVTISSGTGQVSGCIRHLSSLHSPVFLLNSCLDLFSAPRSSRGPFIPKLQGQFA